MHHVYVSTDNKIDAHIVSQLLHGKCETKLQKFNLFTFHHQNTMPCM